MHILRHLSGTSNAEFNRIFRFWAHYVFCAQVMVLYLLSVRRRCLTSNPTLKVQIQLADTEDIVNCCESSMCPTTPLIVPASHQRSKP